MHFYTLSVELFKLASHVYGLMTYGWERSAWSMTVEKWRKERRLAKEQTNEAAKYSQLTIVGLRGRHSPSLILWHSFSLLLIFIYFLLLTYLRIHFRCRTQVNNHKKSMQTPPREMKVTLAKNNCRFLPGGGNR